MNRRLAVGLGALTLALGGGLVLAQETPPGPPPAQPSPAPGALPPSSDEGAPPPPIQAAPTSPGMEPVADPSLANAVTPEESAPPPPEPKRAAVLENTEEADEAPPPKPPEPLKRPRWPAAILQAVDKATAQTLRFEAQVGRPIRYKGLTLTVRACETTAADEDYTDSLAHLEVSSQPQVVAGRASLPPREVYRGWMSADGPALHPLEHPLYDLWLIACKTDAPAAPGASA